MCGKEKQTRSAGRGSGRGKSGTQKLKSVASSISTDIKMGMSTFGQGKEQQAQTLRNLGYSERAIQSFQERTAETQKRLKQTKRDRDRNKKVITTSDDDNDNSGGDDDIIITITDDDDDTSERDTDISGAGATSVTAESIYTRDPEEAMSDQERLAAAELRRQRQQRALSKAERLRTRLESSQKFGPEGRRGGRGRRSLMTGSRGGIGYYSRFK